jgi:hypothetical protein
VKRSGALFTPECGEPATQRHTLPGATSYQRVFYFCAKHGRANPERKWPVVPADWEDL